LSAAGTRKQARTGRHVSSRSVGRSSARRKQRRLSWKARGAVAASAVVVGVIAWAAIARALAPTENTAQDHFDVLIVLGSPADADGNPTPMELERVTEAVDEYERGVASRMIITGGAAHNQYVEADVMARVAEAQGIPAGAIVEERTALDTIQNACDSLKIMRRHGWESAEVISSASHLPRTGLILSRLPLKWRTHASHALQPEGPWMHAATTAIEIAKTARFLLWARQTEKCEVQ
jgi:uncharacterized SAM-binding protein YcdF (DUF218 family)